RAIVELELRRSREPEVCLGDQLGRTKRVARPFAAQVECRDPPQLVIDQRRDLIERGAVPAAPRAEQFGQVLRGLVHTEYPSPVGLRCQVPEIYRYLASYR